ncbi:hypothetical protein SLEP1_g36105 [Rubroshorea leprosula]|uniref:Uncharacterized protein n=1 Tax=Rubroshorea leprosula TaxID=152421 RepID=A0AAV5KR34_9ROSI|nr:hypothetical protein SLEP1_g36105 [Rubroshorea leprosula]
MNMLAHFGLLVVWLKCACLLQTACPCVATFEAFIGVRDDKATAQVKLFGDNLQVLEKNLPLDNAYKSKDVIAAPIYKSKDVIAAHIRVIQLIYNAGDVKGPQTVAFNLPNDERIVKDRGTSMVMLKNVSEAKNWKNYTRLWKKQKQISWSLGTEDVSAQYDLAWRKLMGKPAIQLPLINYAINADCSLFTYIVRKGHALQFNWLFEKKAFTLHPDDTFSVDFDKVEEAVESLRRKILTIQPQGDKEAASLLLQKHCVITTPLKVALQKLECTQVCAAVFLHLLMHTYTHLELV